MYGHPVHINKLLADKPGVKGEDFAYPGLAQPQQGDEKIYHAYYQWVPFVLLLQGMLFYFPHWLWKTLEDRKLDKITNGLRGKFFLKTIFETIDQLICLFCHSLISPNRIALIEEQTKSKSTQQPRSKT